MNILFTVCGRAGSKGLKNKNMKEFLGFPLVHYTLSAIDLFKKSHKEDTVHICVNSDSKELIDLVCSSKLDIINIDRKASLGMDDTPKVSVIRNSLEESESRNNIKYDMIVDVDITSPLRRLKDLENAIEKKKKCEDIDVVFSVVESRRNPYFNMVKNDNGEILKVIPSKFVARQQAPQVYDMNASIYAYKREFLSGEDKNIFDGKVDIIEMLDTAILDIDSENDFELMQVMAEYLFKKYDELNSIRENIKNII